jgi:hypothetical protein
MRLRASLIMTLLIVALATGIATAQEPVRVATFNIESVGAPASTEYEALVEIITRIGAEVVMIQGIAGYADADYISGLAADTGYPYSRISNMGGVYTDGLLMACLSRLPISYSHTWTSAELSDDPSADDITRGIFELHLTVDFDKVSWAIIGVHPVDGGTARFKYRRQIEIHRAMQAVERFRLYYPGSPVILVGDLEEELADGPFGAPEFTVAVPGMPEGFSLGDDITFPFTYDPFVTIADSGLLVLDAFHEDDPADATTRPASGRRLDYMFVDMHLGPGGSEVYDACDDNGVDDPPAGNWLPKVGAPLACGTEAEASGHLAVFGEFDWLAMDQDSDGVDDSRDCGPYDPGAGIPVTVTGLLAEKLPDETARFSWDPGPYADRYDVLSGDLPAADMSAGSCRTLDDPDRTDTIFDNAGSPPPDSGAWFLVRGMDDYCWDPGSYGASSTGLERANEECPEYEAFFCVGDSIDSFVLKLTDPWKVEYARNILAGIITFAVHINGTVVQSHVDWNPEWDFYVIPESVGFWGGVVVTTCDFGIDWVNQNGGPDDGYWCPSASEFLFEIEEGVPTYCGPAR